VVLDCDLGGNDQSLEKMVETMFVNYTQKEIFLKEGNGHLYFYEWPLQPNESQKLLVDLYATNKTFLVCFKRTDNTWASKELSADHCCDYKQVRVCMDSAQNVVFDKIPWSSKMEKKKIKNDCDTNIVLTAVISQMDSVATYEVAQLAPRKVTRTEALPMGGFRKYFLQMVNDSNEKIEKEITNQIFEKRLVVNFTSSDGLSCVP
jgi:hypothetical protein